MLHLPDVFQTYYNVHTPFIKTKMAVRHNWVYAYRMDIFPARLKAARKAKRYTQRQLAVLVGMDQGHISRLENGGKGVSTEHLRMLAKELGVSISHLLGEDLQEESGAYTAAGQPTAILSNYNAPQGLRDLASNIELIGALKITDAEWTALKSVQLPSDVSMDGYVQLLFTIRAIS
jgi:transcriptional regulator with XRE-family HTH domain